MVLRLELTSSSIPHELAPLLLVLRKFSLSAWHYDP